MQRSLRSALAGPDLIVAPGVHDLVSARIADGLGFPALYMTGFGTVASRLGLPDAGIATYSDMVEQVARICERTTTPLIADADTGYGGTINVHATVRGYERAGAAAIQIEDQEMPKKCGHTPGRRVVPAEEMVTKIKVAVDARTRSDTLIVARTDALTQHGLDEALRRAELYVGAGADIIFIEAPESKEQMRTIARRIGRPLLANMVDGGKTPMLSQAELRDIGYRLAIYPVTALLHAAGAVLSAYRALKDGTVPGKTNEMAFSDFNTLIGFDEVRAIEARYARDDRASV
jgi:2-methylisocitrate lyase-like PEP mutase family enzyme